MDIILPPSVEVLRKWIEAAKDRGLEKVRAAAEGTIKRLNIHIESLVKNPEKFTYLNHFSEEMPLGAHHKNGYDEYLNVLRNLLNPLGYHVEQSHDGGGMYSTVIIRWDKEVPKWGEGYPKPMIRNARDLRG
jgi:hypothetical protein